MDPKTLSYAATHEWVQLDGDVATVGISKFAVDQLTDLIMIDLPKAGTEVRAGKSLGEVESVKAVSDIYSPVSGEVLAVNEKVLKNVQILGEDPYEAGWLVKIKLESPELPADLLDYDSYVKKVAEDTH